MPTYELRCPKCGHVTSIIASVATWREMAPVVCECGTMKRKVIHAPALAASRRTEGK